MRMKKVKLTDCEFVTSIYEVIISMHLEECLSNCPQSPPAPAKISDSLDFPYCATYTYQWSSPPPAYYEQLSSICRVVLCSNHWSLSSAECQASFDKVHRVNGVQQRLVTSESALAVFRGLVTHQAKRGMIPNEIRLLLHFSHYSNIHGET